MKNIKILNIMLQSSKILIIYIDKDIGYIMVIMVWLVDLVVRSSGGYFFLTNVNINTLHATRPLGP